MDIHLLEAKVNQLKISIDSSAIVFDHFQRQILDEHGFDSARYFSSLDYYMRNPERLERVYNVVVDSLLLRDNNNFIE